MRDRLVRLGVTMMSAGSHTEPGGYTGAGEESIHQTQRGKAVAVIASEGEHLTRDGAVRHCRRAVAGRGVGAAARAGPGAGLERLGRGAGGELDGEEGP